MKREWIVSVVVLTLAGIAFAYSLTLVFCSMQQIEPPAKVLEYLKDAGIYALGALTSMLVKTTSESAEPTKTTIVNPPSQPIPTTDTDVPGK